MASLIDFIGNIGDDTLPELSGRPYSSNLAPLTPVPAGVDIRSILGGLMKQMAESVQPRPGQEFSDIGTAIFDSIASGSPYGTNMARIQGQRREAVSGATNMFLNVLGLERQMAQAEESRRRWEVENKQGERRLDIADRRETNLTDYRLNRLGQFDRGLDVRRDQGDRRLDQGERRVETAEEAEARRREQGDRRLNQGDRRVDVSVEAETRRREEAARRASRYSVADLGKNLTPEGNVELNRRLIEDPDYKDAYDRDDVAKARERVQFHYNEVTKNSKFIRPTSAGPGTTALQRNAEFLSKELRIPMEDAIRMAREGRDQSDQSYYANVFRSVRSQPGATDADADKAAKAAVEARRQFFGQAAPRRNPATGDVVPPEADTRRTAPGNGEPIPYSPDGKIDAKRLRPGTIYTNRKGMRGRWNGREFEVVE